MSQATEVNNQDKYTSYIQKRRVSFDSYEDNYPAESRIKDSPAGDIEDLSPFKDSKTHGGLFGYGLRSDEDNKYTSSFYESGRFRSQRSGSDFGHLKHGQDKGGGYSSSRYKPYSHQSGCSSRIDASVYQRRRNNSYGLSNRTEIEENKATLLAIKIIKQALACFAILGLIVFLQQRSDTYGTLMFIKSQVVDNHIEVSSLISGVQNIITECTKLFGGSP